VSFVCFANSADCERDFIIVVKILHLLCSEELFNFINVMGKI